MKVEECAAISTEIILLIHFVNIEQRSIENIN
jgi:hypothetical protein